MSDWNAFTESVPWFTDAQQMVEIHHSRPDLALSKGFQERFPVLSSLLRRARVTGVTIDSAKYDLLAWDSDDGFPMGWLCPANGDRVPDNFFKDHRLLLSAFGGIVERINEPEDTWLLNHNDALTLREATHDAAFIADYQWAFDDAGISVPIAFSDYYAIAREANGITTLCHRESGDVILFAADHAYDHITPLKGCPDYTLYRSTRRRPSLTGSSRSEASGNTTQTKTHNKRMHTAVGHPCR